jgi:hypothetical protein
MLMRILIMHCLILACCAHVSFGRLIPPANLRLKGRWNRAGAVGATYAAGSPTNDKKRDINVSGCPEFAAFLDGRYSYLEG